MVLFFSVPIFLLIPLALILGFCFTVLHAGKSILKISKEEILNPKGSLLPLVFKTWGIDTAALFVSLTIMFLLSRYVPFFRGVLSEWGIAYENAYIPAVVYIVCWTILYAAFFSFSYLSFKKAIKNKSKRLKLFFALIIASAIILVGIWYIIIF